MNYRKLTELGRDPHRVRAMAVMISKVAGDRLNERALSFLDQLLRYDGCVPLTTRQLELTHTLHSRATRTRKAGPYVAENLVRKAWERRLDLNDDNDEQWLDTLHKVGPSLALSGPEWRKLFAICRRPEIDLLPSDEWVQTSQAY